ncbi:uncharacterized protein LY89DRAFT_4200 [Mollisia scopiformis]|uniref:Uncharacterized protein n=1 Tax=Mollisia scopiformis TaxID=149040 RepID=A0A194XUE9_MOLSC|nr:uncharacterized protein LY89DRAFT_4200 [Mollisia scopiformis]KUJ23838.1 hypothetical protein LY89DRAFT_4200 [Mollisia scopiformis]
MMFTTRHTTPKTEQRGKNRNRGNEAEATLANTSTPPPQKNSGSETFDGRLGLNQVEPRPGPLSPPVFSQYWFPLSFLSLSFISFILSPRKRIDIAPSRQKPRTSSPRPTDPTPRYNSKTKRREEKKKINDRRTLLQLQRCQGAVEKKEKRSKRRRGSLHGRVAPVCLSYCPISVIL